MEFYKVKKQYDNKRYPGKPKNGSNFFIADELYTEKELKRLGLSIDSPIFDKVKISTRKTCFMFGARFEIKEREK